MSIFSNLVTNNLEQTEDRLGGFTPFATDLYTGKIKLAYAGVSDGGAQYIHLIVVMANNREYSEIIYITNKNKQNFFTKNGKNFPLPGFTTIDDICLMTTEKPLSQQTTEDKMVKVYDNTQKKEVPKSLPVLVDLLDKEITLGIVHQISSKMNKDSNGHYTINTGETRDENFIDKVFHTPTMLTTVEARNGVENAEFHKLWLEKNQGKVRDNTKKGGTAGAGVGAPNAGGAPGMAPQAPAGQAPRQSLFGAKK